MEQRMSTMEYIPALESVYKRLPSPKIEEMGNYFAEKLAEKLKEKDITEYALWKKSKVPQSSINKITNGLKRPTDPVIRLLSKVPDLGLTEDEMLEWRAIDDYPELAPTIIRAIRVRDEDAFFHEFNRRYPDPIIAIEKLQSYIRGEIEID